MSTVPNNPTANTPAITAPRKRSDGLEGLWVVCSTGWWAVACLMALDAVAVWLQAESVLHQLYGVGLAILSTSMASGWFIVHYLKTLKDCK